MASILYGYSGTLFCHATTGKNLETILKHGLISPNALPEKLLDQIDRKGVGMTRILPSLNFSPNFFQDQYSFSNFFPCGFVYPQEVARGFKIADIDDPNMPELSIINMNFNPDVYNEYHRLRAMILNGDRSKKTEEEYQNIVLEYSRMGVRINPLDGILFVPETTLVFQNSGLLAGERGLTYLPYFESQVSTGRYNPNDIPPLPDQVKQLQQQRKELLQRGGVISATEYVVALLKRLGIKQEVYAFPEGVLEEGLPKFIKENNIATREFKGERLNEEIHCEGFTRTRIFVLPTESHIESVAGMRT